MREESSGGLVGVVDEEEFVLEMLQNQSFGKDFFPLGQTLNKQVNITATQVCVALVRTTWYIIIFP